MNLLELMLSRRVLWPVDMRWAVQDKDGKVKFTYNCPPKPPKMDVWDCGQETKVRTVLLDAQATDWRHRVVDYKEYQAAGGWVAWEGGKCPLPKETLIMYRTRTVVAERAKAGDCCWVHSGYVNDIVAYCLATSIPEQGTENAVRALKQIYVKLGVTTLEEAFAVIDEGTSASMGHTIVHGPDTFKDCVILLKSHQTVVWRHNGKEYTSPLAEVLIDPNKDELVAYLLSGLYKIQIDPAHIAEVRDQVHWVYRENQ